MTTERLDKLASSQEALLRMLSQRSVISLEVYRENSAVESS